MLVFKISPYTYNRLTDELSSLRCGLDSEHNRFTENSSSSSIASKENTIFSIDVLNLEPLILHVKPPLLHHKRSTHTKPQ